MAVTAAGWALTNGVTVALLAADLLLATVRPHAVGYREATARSAFYIAVAVVFASQAAGIRYPVLRRVPGGEEPVR